MREESKDKKYNLRMDLSEFREELPKIPGNTMASKIRYLIDYYKKMELDYIAYSGLCGVGKWHSNMRKRYEHMYNDFIADTGENPYDLFIDEELEEDAI
jgi:hypothetical protein